mmetsp:Transcript_52596/g.87313  ORF Transcript_52596/g.87313 Transcript_52596/m.87313 type:complete len:152 (-) Transcript_52596:110-565(-)
MSGSDAAGVLRKMLRAPSKLFSPCSASLQRRCGHQTGHRYQHDQTADGRLRGRSCRARFKKWIFLLVASTAATQNVVNGTRQPMQCASIADNDTSSGCGNSATVAPHCTVAGNSSVRSKSIPIIKNYSIISKPAIKILLFGEDLMLQFFQL